MIAEIASNLFGEPFKPSGVIQETYRPYPTTRSQTPLPSMIVLNPKTISSFDGTIQNTILLMEELMGRPLTEEEKTPEDIGALLLSHPAVKMLQSMTSDGPKPLDDLSKVYHDQHRPTCDLSEAQAELEATILVGSACP